MAGAHRHRQRAELTFHDLVLLSIFYCCRFTPVHEQAFVQRTISSPSSYVQKKTKKKLAQLQITFGHDMECSPLFIHNSGSTQNDIHEYITDGISLISLHNI